MRKTIHKEMVMPAVISKDGTKIAYDKVGRGPAVIVVEGALVTGEASKPLAKLLAADFTVYSYDRRGRGDSTDTKPYSAEKEVEDIEALIDVAGGTAYLYGISSGAALALEAAMSLGDKVKKLALYEAPYDSSEAGIKAWREFKTKLAELLAADDRNGALLLQLKIAGAPDEAIEGMRREPEWKSMEAIAHTLAYDAAVVGEDRVVPSERAAGVTAQVLVMDGGASKEVIPFMHVTAEQLTKAIPGAQHRTLEGQGHDVDDKVLAPVLREFFGKED
jgi:pimeloyl-ACP methyl ester carboxylesterase